jgi:hypothetical protein
LTISIHKTSASLFVLLICGLPVCVGAQTTAVAPGQDSTEVLNAAFAKLHSWAQAEARSQGFPLILEARILPTGTRDASSTSIHPEQWLASFRSTDQVEGVCGAPGFNCPPAPSSARLALGVPRFVTPDSALVAVGLVYLARCQTHPTSADPLREAAVGMAPLPAIPSWYTRIERQDLHLHRVQGTWQITGTAEWWFGGSWCGEGGA